MGWIYLEAAIALAVAIGIVAWTMSARRKPDADAPPRDDDAKLRFSSMQRARHGQRARRYRRLERRAVLAHHLIAALHRADRRGDARAARVLEALAGLQHRLLADDAEAFDFLHAMVAVGDVPVAA